MPMVLRLEEIRMYNFKSFLGTHTIGNLDNHITAIVGPNGSGKSNILDSILFVLGFRAKKMRHAALKDLITLGCTDCEVKLIFNQFEVSRTLHVTGHSSKSYISKYFLNGTEISSSAIQEYLKSAGIDLNNNRFLILQGEIETISTMGPLDLLAYIEDCIGTSAYKGDIELLEREIDENVIALQTANNGFQFAESDFTYKRNRRNEKLKGLAFRRNALSVKYRIISMKAEIGRKKELELLKTCDDLSAILRDLQKKNNQRLVEIADLERRKDELRMKEREEEIIMLRKSAQHVLRDINKANSRNKAINKEMTIIKEEISKISIRSENWKVEAENYRKQLEENKREISDLYKECNDKEKILQSYKLIQEREIQRKKAETKLMTLVRKREEFTKTEGAISHIKTQISELENLKIGKCSYSPEVLSKLENERIQLKSDLTSTFQEIQKRKRHADDFKFIEENYRREQAVIQTLSGMAGVHGPLKTLGEIEKGYEIAVDSATKALGSIVVDTTAVAEECIAIINRNNLNRTTFIILDKINDAPGDEGSNKLRNSENTLNYLYKKINCNKKYLKAFYFAIKDTLVVETMEEAKKLAFGTVRRRVVTLDGKLLEKSGVMSGGKVPKKIKGISELEKVHGDIGRLLEEKEKEIQKYRNYFEELANYERNQNKLHQLRVQLKQYLSELENSELKIIDKQILEIKEVIKTMNEDIPVELKIVLGDIKMLKEKIQYVESVSQDFKIKLSCPPNESTDKLEREYNLLEKELSTINVPEYDSSELDQREVIYKEHLDKFKEFQSAISNMREEMEGDYHEEANLKNRLNSAKESLKECEKIAENCKEKYVEISKEKVILIELLSDCDNEEERALDIDGMELSDEEFQIWLNETPCQEIKVKSREMIEQLGNLEVEYFKNQNDGCIISEEDAQICREVFTEYKISKQNYDGLKNTAETLKKKVDELRNKHVELKNKRYTQFMGGFDAINRNIKEIFTIITFGGNAELDLLNYLDPFSDGIILSIMPPKKAWKSISHLSGGEKTLSSLALIFALHKFLPSSFYIMDEIDAALDYRNVSLIGQYLEQVNSQFIIISLRDNMFERAKSLLGVYKVNNASRALIVRMEDLSI